MQNVHSNKFVFNEQLNAGFLNELFEGDSAYAETVFEDFLRDLPAYWERVESAYKNMNLPQLKTSIHTCKTLFGYVGFTNIQEDCQQFEDSCTEKTASALQEDFGVLTGKKEMAQQIIENEYQRLKIFNKNNT